MPVDSAKNFAWILDAFFRRSWPGGEPPFPPPVSPLSTSPGEGVNAITALPSLDQKAAARNKLPSSVFGYQSSVSILSRIGLTRSRRKSSPPRKSARASSHRPRRRGSERFASRKRRKSRRSAGRDLGCPRGVRLGNGGYLLNLPPSRRAGITCFGCVGRRAFIVRAARAPGIGQWHTRTHAGRKTLIVIAQEDRPGIGRIRMRRIPDASAESLLPFIKEAIGPGSTVHTDGWLG